MVGELCRLRCGTERTRHGKRFGGAGVLDQRAVHGSVAAPGPSKRRCAFGSRTAGAPRVVVLHRDARHRWTITVQHRFAELYDQ